MEFETLEGAVQGRAKMAGRKFGDKTVQATFYPEERFKEGDLAG